MVTHDGLHIGDEGEDVRDGHLLLVLHVEAAALEAADVFYHPEVAAQVVEIDVELAGPEGKEVAQVIDIQRRVAVVPAIDKPQNLGSPRPMAVLMYLRIHSSLHCIKVANLAL